MRRAALPIATLIGLAVAAGPAAAAQPAAVTASAPKTAHAGEAFGIDLRVPSGLRVAGLELTVGTGRDAAEVAAVIPAVGSGTTLAAAGTSTAARVGYYAASGRSAGGTVAQLVVTPKRKGVLQVRLGNVTLVDAAGHVLPARMATRMLSVRVAGAASTFAAPKIAAAARGARHAGLDVDASGRVDRSDLDEAVYAWQVGRAGGDVDGDGRTTVADLQQLSRVAPLKAATRSTKDVNPTKTWVVDTTSDLPDATPGDRICATSAGACSLRAAIDEANRRKGDDLINFAVPGAAGQTIQLTSRLPQLNTTLDAIKIDGYSQPGAHANTDPLVSNALPGVTLRGWSTNEKDAAIMITGGRNIIQGLAFTDIGRGVYLYGANAKGNEIVGNFFGMDALGNRSSYTGYAGINVDGAPQNRLGKPTLADRNVIAGFFYGIDFVSPGADSNITMNNLVGLSPSGAAWGGGCTGVDHNVGPKYNQLGGFGPLERNVVVGYGCDGIEYSHGWNQSKAPREDISIQWQLIGNKTYGNYVGLKPDGTYAWDYLNAKGNTNEADGSGINVIDVSNDNIVEGNVIAAYLNGVQIFGFNTERNIVRNNIIGTDAAGNPSYVGYSGVGVRWHARSNQIIGNQISNTGLAGVRIAESDNDFNLISQNTFTNVGQSVGGIGIDLQPLNTVNPNDAGDADSGANAQLNFPVITAASTTAVTGTGPSNRKVEVYRSYNDPGLYGPGEQYLGSVTVAGNGTWTLPVALQPGDIVTSILIDSTNNTSEFGVNVAVPGAAPNVRGVTYDAFNGFGGVAINDIPAGTAPTASSRVGSFNAPVNRGDNHGTRLRALLRAPQTGEYTFWVASDDSSRVFLSTDSTPANRREIARVQDWVPNGAYDQTPVQKSAAITLQAGQTYYLEAFMKEGGGEDHLSVAWQGPGVATRSIIAGQYLSPTTAGCEGWCPNWMPEGRGLSYEVFNDFGGTGLGDIPAGTAASAPASVLPSFTVPENVRESYGVRVRGLLTAPATGDYTFALTSDDNGVLFLSTDADPANRAAIARVNNWVPSMVFDWEPNQVSAPITLQAGQKYYIEGYMKEGGGGDHLTVAWTGPSIGGRQVVSGVYLEPTTLGAPGWNAVG